MFPVNRPTDREAPMPSQSRQPNEPSQARREALFTIARSGAAGLGVAALLAGCSTAAKRRVDAKGGRVGDPIPEDPVLIREPWSPGQPGSPTIGSPGLDPIAGAVPRARWAKAAPRPWLADPMGSIRRITVHHDAIDPSPSSGPDEVARRLESIRNGHTARGWADIGYHYAIDPAGRIWQCRPLTLQGAHVGDQNQQNLGIVMLGNFERQTPTGPALESLDRLIAGEMRRFRISMGEIRTHREMAATACPGRNLQREMDRTRTRGGRLASLAQGDFRG
jgi:hypothetical protein